MVRAAIIDMSDCERVLSTVEINFMSWILETFTVRKPCRLYNFLSYFNYKIYSSISFHLDEIASLPS